MCPDSWFQQVRAVLKIPDVSSIHERLVATCGEENAFLSLYRASHTEVAGYAACQPPGCCIFRKDKSRNLFLHFGHNETGYVGAIEVRQERNNVSVY